MRFRVIHETRYLYNESVSLCHTIAHLTPRNLPHQRVVRTQLVIDPVPSAYGEHLDIFGNTVSYFALQLPHNHLTATAASIIEVKGEPQPTERTSDLNWEEARDKLKDFRTPGFLQCQYFMTPSPHVALSTELASYAALSFTSKRPALEAFQDLMERLHRDFAFVAGYTTVSTPLHEVLKTRKGVCQDFAHLGIGCLRSMGLAARYVSGYIETIPPPGKEKMRGADVSHAWYAVYLPDLGWLEYDPTNNVIPCNQHVTVAYGRDYSDVVPLKGVIFSSGSQQLLVAVDMERLKAGS